MRKTPFYHMQLNDACLKILQDHAGEWFSRKQVEYMLVYGGYESDAKDPSNSVDVTLRLLAEKGKCEVNSQRGKVGNRYMIPAKKGGADAVEDSRATTDRK